MRIVETPEDLVTKQSIDKLKTNQLFVVFSFKIRTQHNPYKVQSVPSVSFIQSFNEIATLKKVNHC